MKTKIRTFDIYLCKRELDYLRKHNPCLLNQAYEYGYERGSSDHHFYNQPKVLVNNIKLAVKRLYYIV